MKIKKKWGWTEQSKERMIGKNNPMFGVRPPNYKGGKPKCCDCNKQLSDYRFIRCARCNYDFHSGENHHNFKGGKPNCIDCGKLLSAYVYARCLKCCKIGKLNSQYIHGQNNLPYTIEFTPKLKLEIRKRDNFTCQNPECRITEKQHNKKFDRTLDIHHIDYNKENCSKEKLITTCHICNVTANGDRDYWYAFYSYIMEEIKCGST